ncbi:MAG: GYD domain-containing protein [Bryobacteraceae bacterium]
MPKYLIQGSYTAGGLQGLKKDTAAGRRAAVQAAVKALGGKLESFHFSFGEDDVVLIVDLPDNVAAAAIATTASGSGTVRLHTTPLLTVDEADKALAAEVKYRPAGAGK